VLQTLFGFYYLNITSITKIFRIVEVITLGSKGYISLISSTIIPNKSNIASIMRYDLEDL